MASTDNSKATSIETNQYIKNPKYTTKEAIDKFVHLLILGRYTEKDLSDALNYCLIRSTESFDSIDSIKKAIEELKKDSEAFKIFIDNTNKLLDAIQEINAEQNTEINKINEFLKTAVTLDTEQTITGAKTFNKIYVSDPTENRQAANAQYVMDYVRNQLSLTIGDLNNLKTESKDLIVNAINEVLDNLNTYEETINETTINQMIDTKLNPLIGRITTIESTVDYTKELAEANKQAIDDLNTKVVDNTSDITDINRRLEEAVFYSKINDTRKTIQLKNYDSISGVSTTGAGINIAMVSKWDKVDLGSTQIPINLNGSETRPTYNDSKEMALMDDVNLKADSNDVYNKSEIDTKLETKANSSSVYNKEDSDARFVSLTEDQSIEGNKIIEGIWEYNGVLSKPKQLATTEYSKNYSETYTNQKVGDLTSLKTEAKDTAVAAINELFDKIGSGDTGGPVDTYTKQEIDSKLDLKADASGVYNKSEIDHKFENITIDDINYAKKDAANIFTKANTFTEAPSVEVDATLDNHVIRKKQFDNNIKEINDKVESVVGDLNSLNNEVSKDNLVNAINSVDDKFKTTAKTNESNTFTGDQTYVDHILLESVPSERNHAVNLGYILDNPGGIKLPDHTALTQNSITEITFGYANPVAYSAQTLKNIFLKDIAGNEYKAIMADVTSFTANPSKEMVVILSRTDYTKNIDVKFDITKTVDELKQYELKEGEVRVILSYDIVSVYSSGYGYGAMFARNANKKDGDLIYDYYFGSQNDITNNRKVSIKIDKLGINTPDIVSISMTTNGSEKLTVKTDTLDPVENTYESVDMTYIHTPVSKIAGDILYSNISQAIKSIHILENNICSLKPAEMDTQLVRLKEFNNIINSMLQSMFGESPVTLKNGDYIDVSFSGSASYGTGYCGYVNIKDTIRDITYKAYKVSSNAFDTTSGTKVIAVLTSDNSKINVTYSDSVSTLESYEVAENEILLEISFYAAKQYSAKYGYGAMLEYWGSVSDLCYDYYMGSNLDMNCPFKITLLKIGSSVKADTIQLGAPTFASSLVMHLRKNTNDVINFLVSTGRKVIGRDGTESGSVYDLVEKSLKPLKVLTSEAHQSINGITTFNNKVYMNINNEKITDSKQLIHKEYLDKNITDNVAYNISNTPLVPYNDVSSLNTKNICVKISATTDSSNYSSGDTVVVSNFKIKLKGDNEYLKPYGVEVIDRENNKIGLNLIGDDTVYNDNDALLSTRPSDFNSSSVDLSSGSNALVTVKTNGAYDYSGVYDIPNPFREYNKKYSLFLSNDGLKNPYYQVDINSSKQVDNISFQLFGTSATNPFLYSKDCKIELFIENTIVKTFNIKGSSGNNSPVNINIDYKDGMFLVSVLDSINYINNRINKNAELLTGSGKPNFSLNPNKIGSLYSDITNKAVYMCIDNTSGANKWVNIVTGDEIKPNLRKIEITCNVRLRSGQYGGCMSGVKIGFDNGYASTKQIVKGLNSGQILLSLDGLGNLSGYSEVSSLTPSSQDIKVDVDTTGIYNDPSYHCVTNIFKEYLGNADQCSLWSDASVKQLKITLLSEKIPNKILYVGDGYYGQTSVSDVKAIWYYVNDDGVKIEGSIDNDLEISNNDSETNDSSYIYAFNIN
ncbi:putative tail fiber protein [Campylobacter phage vB_CjeM_WX1]|nr:putative tail fiber protein [Campylobacter phage vB_CjeM_WX1]